VARELPGAKSGSPELWVVEKFGTLNTKATRPAIKDEEFSWIENWMPIGDGNLRTTYDKGANWFASGTPGNILYQANASFSGTAFGAGPFVFFTDGTAKQILNSGGTTQTISSVANTFYNPGVSTAAPQCAQWEDKYLLIISSASDNGYFIWDGINLFQAGTLSPDVTISDSGTNYTSPPTITAFGGAGSGATFSATVSNGSIDVITVTNPGSGYALDDEVQLAFSGGGSDTTATAHSTIATTAGVASVDIITHGHSFDNTATITFSGGGGSGAQAVISGLVNGQITEVTVTNPGSGYTSQPTVTANGPSGSGGFTASADIRGGQLATLVVDTGGTGYNGAPEVQIGAPDSDALPLVQATATAIVSGGAVTGFTIVNPGFGYTKPPLVTLIGGNAAASASVTLMPFGISGTTIETYNDAVWTANGTKVSFTAPGTTSNFATSAGGGSFRSTDNFLRQQIVCLKQANGFLYLLGDSSINVISNVQTTANGTLATTSFNNSNVDPQIGCGWRDTVVPFNRALVFANPNGVYALYGGAAQRVSSPLDGLFIKSQPFFTGGGTGIGNPSAALSTLFSIPVYLLNFETVDYLGVTRYLMTVWDGQKWFVGSQSTAPTFVSYIEDFSSLTAWGTDGTHIFEMFTTPSALSKVLQTRLRPSPAGMLYAQQVNTLYATGFSNAGSAGTLGVSIDNEMVVGTPQSFTINTALTLTQRGTQGAAVYGRLLGMTATTTDEDMTLVNLALLYDKTYSAAAP